jgi:hypothetical protein
LGDSYVLYPGLSPLILPQSRYNIQAARISLVFYFAELFIGEWATPLNDICLLNRFTHDRFINLGQIYEECLYAPKAIISLYVKIDLEHYRTPEKAVDAMPKRNMETTSIAGPGKARH